MVQLHSLKISEDFLREEIRCGYKVESRVKRFWAVELDLLKRFSDVCAKYQLSYFVEWGTLLGAVRHGGFVPWDDDIDIGMMRGDFDRFCEIAPDQFELPYYFHSPDDRAYAGDPTGIAYVGNAETTMFYLGGLKDSALYHQGIYIPIHVFDAFPPVAQSDRFFELLMEKKVAKDSARKKFIRAQTEENREAMMLAYRDFNGFASSNPIDSTTKKIGMFTCTPGNLAGIHDYRDYREYIMMPFEMLEVPVPIGYKNILRQNYGAWRDYVIGAPGRGMDTLIFDADRPYQYYLDRYQHDPESLLAEYPLEEPIAPLGPGGKED